MRCPFIGGHRDGQHLDVDISRQHLQFAFFDGPIIKKEIYRRESLALPTGQRLAYYALQGLNPLQQLGALIQGYRGINAPLVDGQPEIERMKLQAEGKEN